MKDNEFRCAICKQVFITEFTDEEAEMQLAEEFPGYIKEECELVCDDCYREYFEGR